MTQPLFTLEAVEEMINRTSHVDILIFPGIFPVISSRNAEFLHNEVPEINVPAELCRQLASYEDVVDQRKAAPIVDGLYIIRPLNKWKIALDYVRRVREVAYKGSGRAEKYCKSHS